MLELESEIASLIESAKDEPSEIEKLQINRQILQAYTLCWSNFGAGVSVKGRREYVHVGSVTASLLSKPLPNTPAPPCVNAEI